MSKTYTIIPAVGHDALRPVHFSSLAAQDHCWAQVRDKVTHWVALESSSKAKTILAIFSSAMDAARVGEIRAAQQTVK